MQLNEEKTIEQAQMRLDELNLDALKMTMKSRNGRRFVHSVLEQCGVGRNAFAGQRELTDFNCGQQNIGHWLLAQLNTHCPENYLTMLKEHKEDLSHDHRKQSNDYLDHDSIAVIVGGNRGKHADR